MHTLMMHTQWMNFSFYVLSGYLLIILRIFLVVLTTKHQRNLQCIDFRQIVRLEFCLFLMYYTGNKDHLILE